MSTIIDSIEQRQLQKVPRFEPATAFASTSR